MESAEGRQVLATAEGLLDRGSFAVEGGIAWEGRDGRRYAPGGPGMAVLALPLVATGRALEPLCPAPMADAAFSTTSYVEELVVQMGNPLLGALAASLLLLLARELGLGARPSLELALIYGLATVAWPDAKHAFPQPAMAVCLLASARQVHLVRCGRSRRHALHAGLALGAGVLVHVGSLVALPALLTYLVLPAAERSMSRRDATQRFLAGLLPALLLLGAFNLHRFDSPFLMGYEAVGVPLAREAPLLFALHAHLFSSGASLFFYSPPLLLAALSFPDLWRRRRAEAWLVLLLVLGFFLSFGRMNLWHGGWGWGVRYQSPWLPFALLALGPRLQAGRRALAALFLALGLAVQLLGAGVAYEAHLGRSPNALHGKLYEDQAEVWFVPSHSPLVGHARLLAAFTGDLGRRLRGEGRGEPLLYGRGFLRAERLDDGTRRRRAEEVATLHVAPSTSARRLELVVDDGEREGDAPCALRAVLDGGGAPAASVTVPPGERVAISIAIPASEREVEVTLHATPRAPGATHAPAFALWTVALDGRPLDVDGRISWAGTDFPEKDGLVHRGLDLWWIKVFYSDLPGWLLLVPALLACGAIAALRALWRPWRT